MNREQFKQDLDEIAWCGQGSVRRYMAAGLVKSMEEVFDVLEELELKRDRLEYLEKQLHFQQQINEELEYTLGNEKLLENRLEVVRERKAKAKKALNAIFAGCTPEDFPVPDVTLDERIKAQQDADRAIANLRFIQEHTESADPDEYLKREV